MINKKSVTDIVDNKYNTIYIKNLNIALDKYAKMLGFLDINDLKSKYVILETPSKDLLSAPKIILKSKSTPVKIIKYYLDNDGKKYTLEDFWPSDEFLNNEYKIVNIQPEENFGKDELIDIDYARGIGRIYNKYTNIHYELPLNKIPKKIKVSKNITLNDTFLNLLNTK